MLSLTSCHAASAGGRARAHPRRRSSAGQRHSYGGGARLATSKQGRALDQWPRAERTRSIQDGVVPSMASDGGAPSRSLGWSHAQNRRRLSSLT